MGRITVFEVAAEAGVSVATVDRVLNQRGNVRMVTVDRVQAAVSKLGFRRDAFAAGLATRRVERFIFLLPSGPNSFMLRLHDRVSTVARAVSEQRVEISVTLYEAFNEAALCAALAEIGPERCHGVAVVGLDAPGVRREIDRLCAAGVGVVTLISDVTPSRRQGFIGVDNKAAGRVAASLIGRMARPAQGEVAMVLGRMTLHDHVERRLGFEQVLRRDFPGLTLLPVLEGHDDSTRTEPLLERLLRNHPGIVGLYSIGAGNRGVIAALRACGANPVVVAHELSPHARDALLDGIFTVVLGQDCDQEVDDTLSCLRQLARGEPISAPGPARTQIFLRDNVP